MKNKEVFIEKAGKLGYVYEAKYHGCAQCTIIGIFDALGITNPLVVKAGTALGAGGGKMCDGVCGGYSGGMMAMSSIFGRRQSDMDGDVEEKTSSNRMAQDLHLNFIDKYDSVICKELHMKIFGRKYDLNCDEDIKQFEADGAHDDKCTSVVQFAAETATALIIDEAERRGLTIEELRKKIWF